LKKLISETSTPYPITPQRFKEVRDYSLKKFRRFYGLRTLCITSIMAALF
jgi:hypothetical protein